MWGDNTVSWVDMDSDTLRLYSIANMTVYNTNMCNQNMYNQNTNSPNDHSNIHSNIHQHYWNIPQNNNSSNYNR